MSDRLKELDRKLRAVEARRKAETQASESGASNKFRGAEKAWRMVIELVSGIAIGTAFGLGIDYLLGTRPIFLVIFVFLGFAAGLKVMLKTAQEFQRSAERGAAADEGKE